MNPEVNQGKLLVETWGKVLLTSGYIDYDKNMQTSGPIQVSKHDRQDFFRHAYFVPQRLRGIQKEIQGKQTSTFNHKQWFFTEFRDPGGLKKMRETCKSYPALVSCQNSFMVPSYDPKLFFA